MTSGAIEVDEDLCIGSGDCVLSAPRAFLLEDKAVTVAVLPTYSEESADALADAAMNCPTGAITVVADAGA